MNLITTFRSRRRSGGPVVLVTLAIGLMAVILPSCVQAADELQILYLRQAVDAGPHCDSATDQGCAGINPGPVNYLVKPTHESPGLAALPAPNRVEWGSLSQLLAPHKPARPAPPPPGLPLRIRYCVYLK